MDSHRWKQVQVLFEEALAQPDEERSAFIRSACGGDVELRDELISLLAIRLRSRNEATRERHDLLHELPAGWLGALAKPKLSRFCAGDRIGNRYLVKASLGRGGMGEVYEAWDEELSISVALKTLHVSGAEESLQRLKLESLLARSVSHPNVCRVYDLSRHDDGTAAVWLLTMELLRGETAAERLRKDRVIPPDRALRFAEQMAAGLGAAHQAGVVHRDFKPDNVMLVGHGADEQAVVMDFGISQATWQGPPDGGKRGSAVFGTPAYMAPEQLRGETVGPAADIYALGIVLYEMVTGSLPFTGRSAIEAAQRRLKENPPSPRSIMPELDQRWDAVILRCLAREARQRFGRAEEVIEALAGREVGAGQHVGTIPRYSLPAERGEFVGRESEIEALEGHFAGRAPVVTLLGAAGMGKTRLAVRYGWRTIGEWPGGVWFCDLTEAQDVNGIASAVAGPLGVQLGREDPIERLGHAFYGRGRCLVILDNFEQVADHAATTLGRWTQRAKEARFLVTSRVRLGLAEEESVQGVEPLSLNEGMRLFEGRARWLRPGVELLGSEADSAREIVRLADGMPLAIELAATRMRVMSAAQIASQMRKRFQLLTGGPGVRHATLEAAIDGSWETMCDWEQAAWTQLAVFEGGFTLEAAEAVVDLTAWPEAPWLVDVIQSLVDKSLLRTWVPGVAPSGELPEARFGMYVSLQDYARMKLRDGAEAASAEERHGNWYGRFGSEEALQVLDHEGGVARWRRLEQELDNLMAACRRAVRRGDGQTIAAVYGALWKVLELRGPFAPAVDLGNEALGDSRLGRAEKVRVMKTLGQAESYSGRTREARTHLEAALELARELGNRRLEGSILDNLGGMHFLQGHPEEARIHLEMALALARADRNRALEGMAVNNLGAMCRDLGRMDEARMHFEKALAVVRAVGNRRDEGTVLGNLGLLDQDQGRLEESRTHYEAALAIHREVGNRRFEGNILCNLGGLGIIQGRVEEARVHLDAALAIHRDLGDRRCEGIALTNRGSLHVERGQLGEGRDDYEAALAIHRELGNQRFEAEVLMNLADLLNQGHRTEEALEFLRQGEVILRQLDAPVEMCKIFCIRAEIEHDRRNAAAAREALSAAEALAIEIGSGPESELGQMVAKVRQALSVMH